MRVRLVLSRRGQERVLWVLSLSVILFIPACKIVLGSNQLSVWRLGLVIPVAVVLTALIEPLARGPLHRTSARFNAWAIRRSPTRKVELFRFGGAPVIADGTFFLIPIALLPSAVMWPALGVTLIGASSAVMLIHELGHAVAARRRRCPVASIELYALHGRTVHATPWTERDWIVIAWGGVLAQLIVAAPACAWLYWRAPSDTPTLVLLWTLGPYSLLMIASNLLPIEGLDGKAAWRLFRRKPRWRPNVVRFPRE